jgi:succinate dehydrogenase/fumarate reductase flavoprotein subunit
LLDIKRERTDVLIIGSGGAGLRAAIEARRYGVKVTLVDKVVIGMNNSTRYSGGGIKAALPGILSTAYTTQYQDPREHFRQAMIHGEYLNDEALVEIMTFEGPARVLELKGLGVDTFDAMYLKVHYPHGSGLIGPLVKTARTMGCSLRPGMVITQILVEGGRVVGAAGVDIYRDRMAVFETGAIVIATGGAAETFLRNDTTVNTTGDGYTLALDAGASLRDMEIVQFEPYVQAEPGLPMMDRHEAEAEFHGVLRNALNEDFLVKYLPAVKSGQIPFEEQFGMALTDIRERVARAMVTEVAAGRGDNGAVLFDLRQVPAEKWQSDFASQYTRNVLLRGFDVEKKPVHVLPGAICTLGGIAIDADCRTDVPGLFAAGEATGGVHGAARLGGDGLLDPIVFGARAGRSAALAVNGMPEISQTVVEKARAAVQDTLIDTPADLGALAKLRDRVKRTMWEQVGILRNGEAIAAAIPVLDEVAEQVRATKVRSLRQFKTRLETLNLARVGRMIAGAAARRTESRGAHFRTDFPQRDDGRWLVNHFVRQKGKELVYTERPIKLRTTQLIKQSKFGIEVK